MYENRRLNQRRSMENLKELRTKVQRQLLNQASAIDSFQYENVNEPSQKRTSQLTKSL